ncbi:MAG: hypothetical protein M4579_003877 [Chaenotheca gracillima]|nr:MAG: hypothetical protein M4579_003877 [Chaenotheca gracillima]
MAARLHVSDKNSNNVRKRIESHKFEDEEGDEYNASNFGGFADYFRRKKIKLQNLDAELRSSGSDRPQIFRGVVAHVNGYTQPSLNDLHALIVTHGGGFLQYLDGKTTVTHLIASSLTPKKRVEFRRYRIVKPAWVVESVKAGRLLPWDNFRVIDEGIGQKILGFDDGKVVNQTNDQHRGYTDQTNESWYTEQLKTNNSGHAESSNDISVSNEGETLPDKEAEGNQTRQIVQEDMNLDDLKDVHGPPAQEGSPSLTKLESNTVPSNYSSAYSDSRLVAEDISPGSEQSDKQVTSGITERNSNDTPPTFLPSEQLRSPSLADTDTSPYSARPSGEKDAGSPSGALKRQYSTETGSPSKRAKLTAEEHNAVLLSDPRMWKSSVLNPNFLQQYYSESRLHHLSSWKANLKAEMQQLAKEKSSSQNARQKRKPGARRYVLHVDFDSFFAAVSLKDVPQFKEKPVVVAHGSGSGSEIASCNYPARKFGVRNGMWMKKALELCPDLKVLPYDFKAYEEASRTFYEAILDTGGIVQSVSIDEALVDVSETCLDAGGSEGKGVQEGSIWREQTHADNIASGLRDNIKKGTGCAVSVGIGGNILLAKVALRKAKPAGQYQIKPDEVLDFIGNLTVQDLPGVAYHIGGKLEEIGVKLVKDVRELSKPRLMSVLGPKTGEKIFEYARGIDRTEVGDQVIRKSVSAEVNWGVRFETQAQAEEFVHNLCGELHRRLVDQKVKGRQLTMKIMRRAQDAPLDPPKHLGHGKCDVFNKSVVLGVATNEHEVLSREALSILRGHSFSPGELRGLGVQMTKLDPLKDGGQSGLPDGSQKRLQFKNAKSPKVAQSVEDPIVDEIESPHKPKVVQSPVPPISGVDSKEIDPLAKPLNTLGTQFIVPSQIDPSVLAELPEDIRSKLIPAKRASPFDRPLTPAKPQRPSHSPTPPTVPPDILPSESQLDPETLAALPQDVKDEILAAYRQQSSTKANAQTLLPQSPRKIRPAITSQKKHLGTLTSNKKRGGLFSRVSKHDPSSTTLTQSNFVSKPPPNPTAAAANQPAFDTDLSATSIAPDFLEALPPEIRQEILAHQKRLKLQNASNLSLPTSHRNRRPAKDAGGGAHQPAPQRRLRLPPRPMKPTFTTHKLTKLDELREVVRAWYGEFADDGPYDEDVDALGKYLNRVVEEEKDLDKALGVVKWMDWIVEEGNGADDIDGGGELNSSPERVAARKRWCDALEMCKASVQEAVKSRGLGDVEF